MGLRIPTHLTDSEILKCQIRGFRATVCHSANFWGGQLESHPSGLGIWTVEASREVFQGALEEKPIMSVGFLIVG